MTCSNNVVTYYYFEFSHKYPGRGQRLAGKISGSFAVLSGAINLKRLTFIRDSKSLKMLDLVSIYLEKYLTLYFKLTAVMVRRRNMHFLHDELALLIICITA